MRFLSFLFFFVLCKEDISKLNPPNPYNYLLPDSILRAVPRCSHFKEHNNRVTCFLPGRVQSEEDISKLNPPRHYNYPLLNSRIPTSIIFALLVFSSIRWFNFPFTPKL